MTYLQRDLGKGFGCTVYLNDYADRRVDVAFLGHRMEGTKKIARLRMFDSSGPRDLELEVGSVFEISPEANFKVERIHASGALNLVYCVTDRVTVKSNVRPYDLRARSPSDYFERQFEKHLSGLPEPNGTLTTEGIKSGPLFFHYFYQAHIAKREISNKSATDR